METKCDECYKTFNEHIRFRICLKCHSFVCIICQRKHTRNYSGHNFRFPLLHTTRYNPKCRQHYKDHDVICLDCNEFVCSTCLTVTHIHKGHKTILIDELANEQKQEIASEIDNTFIEISGLVTENGEAVSGALVLLVASASISDGFGLSNGSITTDNGNYIIIDVDAGEYYIVAVEDSNGNLQFDIESDRLGFYGVNLDEFDIVPDIVTVSDEDIEDINITYLTSM